MSSTPSTVERADFGGRAVWVKRYGSGSRAGRLRAMDWLARKLGVAALRPPPHRGAAEAKRVERERLQALAEAGVHVPEVVGEGEALLILSDMGETLSSRLRSEPGERARQLVAQAAQALAEAHAAGAYLGQPVARNLTIDAEGRIGFLDFEEDPREVMSLHDAQTRDWLLFASGVVRHVPGGADAFAASIGDALRHESDAVRASVSAAAGRLAFVESATRWLGRRAGGLGAAVRGLRRALHALPVPLILVALLADYLHDGDIEALSLLMQLVD
ncbi:phosphotransferase [Coralloluteibacterium thermophilus]|uniref:Phosphotransferase n=1 Tax=Coralloluteibacterium thermophilum TaxID=2707049 RepID=A0ABV9NHW7_9GAMM